MIHTAEQLIASTQANVQSLKNLSSHAFMGLERLAKLNAAFSKAAMLGAFQHTQELLDIKNPQQLLLQQVGLLKPLGEKSSAYAWEVYALAFESGTEFSKAAEAKLAETQRLAFNTLERVVESLPLGSESALNTLKNAMSAGQEAIVSAQGSAKQAVELAESSFASMSKQGGAASTATAKTH